MRCTENCTISGNEIRHFRFLLIYQRISTIRLRNDENLKRFLSNYSQIIRGMKNIGKMKEVLFETAYSI